MKSKEKLQEVTITIHLFDNHLISESECVCFSLTRPSSGACVCKNRRCVIRAGNMMMMMMQCVMSHHMWSVAYPGIFFGGVSTNSVEDRGQRGRGSGGGSPLLRGSGGSCNLVQEISFHIVKFS